MVSSETDLMSVLTNWLMARGAPRTVAPLVDGLLHGLLVGLAALPCLCPFFPQSISGRKMQKTGVCVHIGIPLDVVLCNADGRAPTTPRCPGGGAHTDTHAPLARPVHARVRRSDRAPSDSDMETRSGPSRERLSFSLVSLRACLVPCGEYVCRPRPYIQRV